MESQRRAGWFWVWGAGYVTLMVIVVWSLISARTRALAVMATPQSIQAWQTWRNDVREQQESPRSVARRVPKSSEPPMLVLLRDHFAVMMAGAILFSTVLYVVMAWFITGALSTRPEADDVSALQ